jgi:hypothetical protein
VLVENTKESDTKESFVTVVVLKLLRKKIDRVGHINLLCQSLISGISVHFLIIGYILGLPSKN